MSNPIKSRSGFAFLPILIGAGIALGAAGVGAALLRDKLVTQGQSMQADQSHPTLGKGMEFVGRLFGGETPAEKAEREALAKLPKGANPHAIAGTKEDVQKQLSKDQEIAKKAAEWTDADDAAVVADLTDMPNIAAPATPGVPTDAPVGKAKTDKEKADGGQGAKDQSTTKNDGGRGIYSAPSGKNEGEPADIAGTTEIKGKACEGSDCLASSKDDSKSKQTEARFVNESSEKGPFYAYLGPGKVPLVDQCPGETVAMQTGIPGPGAWSCARKDGKGLSESDLLALELEAGKRSIALAEKTDKSKAAELKKAYEEKLEKAGLLERLERLPYDSKLKDSLKEMLFKASAEDAARTIGDLEKFKPDIRFCSGCDTTSINVLLDKNGKVDKTTMILPETFQGSDGRVPYSALATAADLAESIALVQGVQNGRGGLSSEDTLEAQNLRDSIVQSGQVVTTQQIISAPETAVADGGRTALSSQESPAKGGESAAETAASADALIQEEIRRYRADQKEAFNDILQKRTPEQVQHEIDRSETLIAIYKIHRAMAEAILTNKSSSREATDAARKEYLALQTKIETFESKKKELGQEKDRVVEAEKKLKDDAFKAFTDQANKKKKAIEESRTLSDTQKYYAKLEIDKTLAQKKANYKDVLKKMSEKL